MGRMRNFRKKNTDLVLLRQSKIGEKNAVCVRNSFKSLIK